MPPTTRSRHRAHGRFSLLLPWPPSRDAGWRRCVRALTCCLFVPWQAIVPCVLAPRECMFRTGDIGTQFYMVYRGRVELKLGHHPSNLRTFCVLIDNGICGEISVISGKPRLFSAFVREQVCYAAYCNKKDVMAIAEECPALWVELKREAKLKQDVLATALGISEDSKQPDVKGALPSHVPSDETRDLLST